MHCVGGLAPPGATNIYDIVHGMGRLYGNNALYVWNGSTFSPGIGAPVPFKARITLGTQSGALYEYDTYNLGWNPLYDNRNVGGDNGTRYEVIFDMGGTSSPSGAQFYVEDVVVEYVNPS